MHCEKVLMLTVLCFLAAVFASASPKPWDYQPTTRDPSYSAWYQVPKPGPGPYPSAAAYERPSPASYDRGYHGFNVPRHGGYSPEGNMMPQMPRKTPVNGYYPHQAVISSGSDPNAELFAAIKDVVNKFRASIDQSGLQQDVRHMGTQLQNTWDQLRRGPVNEQLGRLFERAQQAVADAVTEDEAQRRRFVRQH